MTCGRVMRTFGPSSAVSPLISISKTVKATPRAINTKHAAVRTVGRVDLDDQPGDPDDQGHVDRTRRPICTVAAPANRPQEPGHGVPGSGGCFAERIPLGCTLDHGSRNPGMVCCGSAPGRSRRAAGEAGARPALTRNCERLVRAASGGP